VQRKTIEYGEGQCNMNRLSIGRPAAAKRRLLLHCAALGALFLWSGSGVAQRYESPNAGPLRTISEGADARLMLYGYDAVAYFKQNDAVKGDPAIKAEHLGVTWRFASEANKQAFLAAPEQYMPQFGGYCSNGINYAIPGGGGGGRNTWRIYRGKLYVFGGQAARDQFEMDTELNLQRAHKYWNEEVAGHPPDVDAHQAHDRARAALQDGSRSAGRMGSEAGCQDAARHAWRAASSTGALITRRPRAQPRATCGPCG
jgi:YHS domain-containing protein